jgi:alkylation response protein AidB-like acyl-CoA dehydrogenase
MARAAGYYACWAADAAPAAERHRASTMALAFAADDLAAVGASAVQVHGGIGFTWEHDVHLFYKRLLTLQRTGGGTVDQLEELAAITLG